MYDDGKGLVYRLAGESLVGTASREHSEMEKDEGARRSSGGSATPANRWDEGADGGELDRKIEFLLRQGRELFSNGSLQQAIHVWTRILFLDRNNKAARKAIGHAKRAIAERQRQLDALVLEAESREKVGDRRGAQIRLSQVLTVDPRHSEGRSLREKIEEEERRGEARSGSLSLAGKPMEVGHSKAPRRRTVMPRAVATDEASPLKMAVFLFSALCLFAAGGLYLHLNWDFLISDGGLSASRPAGMALSQPALPALPKPAELHYYNGARLYAKGLYRDALSELALVDRECPNFEEARSLILRIEERLLRGSVMAGTPIDSLASHQKGE
jgi:tetratricopeptide (TPR) repeat protein